MTRLSIIITVYKNSDTLTRCLDSVAASLGRAGEPGSVLELIAVLDGPDQEALAILRENRHSLPIHIIELASRSGIASARNAGANAASHEWITFLDGDDEFTTARIIHLPSIDPTSVYVGKQEIVWDTIPSRQLPSYREFHDDGEFHLSSMLVSRSIFQRLKGLDPEFSLGDDWDFAVRLREKGVPIEYVSDTFVLRHVTGSNASLDQEQIRSDYFKSLRKHLSRRK